ncbi:MAG TPA: uroporphyrinogen-III synthase [Bacteroidetes bacterium]|nr:uroporphyrinogen-III synthase [Bacteroidota bacterium]HIL56823.1 uroporphyrinogen-III synthase [Rhodothermales bacterium]
MSRRIVVTRAEEQAHPLADAIRQRGWTPLLVPSIRFVPMDAPAPLAEAACEIDGAAWVVFTSRTGVRFGMRAIRETRADGWPAGVRIAAVGPGTAEALREEGVTADFVPRDAIGDVLVEELPLTSGDRVVLLRSHIGREAIVTGLAARGAVVDDVPAYRTLTEADPHAAAQALGARPDAVTFTSPSTVRGFLSSLPDLGPLADVALVAIGPVTADALAPFGLHANAVADPHTVPGLLATLDRLFLA